MLHSDKYKVKKKTAKKEARKSSREENSGILNRGQEKSSLR